MTKKRHIALTAIAGLFFLTKSFATLWTGTITETVTQTTDPSSYQVGNVFSGCYSYESDTMDGTFYGDHLPGAPVGANCSLGGLIFMPFVTTASFDLGPYGGPVITRTGGLGPTYASLDANDRVASLSVIDGIVSLSWLFDDGFVFAAGGDRFLAISFGSGLPITGPDVRGSIAYGAPTAVPENASTLSLLFSAAFLGWLFKFSRPLLRRFVS